MITRRAFMSAAAGVVASLCLPLKAIKAAIAPQQRIRFVSPNSVFTKFRVNKTKVAEFPYPITHYKPIYISKYNHSFTGLPPTINTVAIPIDLYEASDTDSAKAMQLYDLRINIACGTLLLAAAKNGNNIISYNDMCSLMSQKGKLKFVKYTDYIIAVDNTRDSVIMPISDYLTSQKYGNTFCYWSWLGMAILNDKSVWAAKLPLD